MAVGPVMAHWELFTCPRPWKRLLLSLEMEPVRLHFMVLAFPFFLLIAWLMVRDNYQTSTIVMLMGAVYLVPNRHPSDRSNGENGSNKASERTSQAPQG